MAELTTHNLLQAKGTC